MFWPQERFSWDDWSKVSFKAIKDFINSRKYIKKIYPQITIHQWDKQESWLFSFSYIFLTFESIEAILKAHSSGKYYSILKNMATKSKRRFESLEKRSTDWMPYKKQFIHLMKMKGWNDPKG